MTPLVSQGGSGRRRIRDLVRLGWCWHAWPRLIVTYENQGPDFHILDFAIGAPYSDPLFNVCFNLGRETR